MTGPGQTVTIGLPLRNGAAGVEKALEGILAQSYTDWILIVSDNASSDGSWEILQKWAERDARIQLHRQEADRGIYWNFRFVLDQADTEYFMWHAHDDHIPPDYLECLVALLAADPECRLACARAVHVEADGSVQREIPYPAPETGPRLERMRALLGSPEATRIYGVYRTRGLRQLLDRSERAGGVWGGDYRMLVELIANDRVRGTNGTTFEWQRAGTARIYRPVGRLARARFMAGFIAFHLRALATSRLAIAEKIAVAPSVVTHAVRTTYPDVFRTFVKRPIKRLVRAPVRAARRR